MHLFGILNRSLLSTEEVCDFGWGESAHMWVLHTHLQPYDLGPRMKQAVFPFSVGSDLLVYSDDGSHRSNMSK